MENTTDSIRSLNKRELLRTGAWSFIGIFLLTLFAAMFVRVKVSETTQWSLHSNGMDKLGRALLASFATGAIMSLVVTGVTALRQRVPGYRRFDAGR